LFGTSRAPKQTHSTHNKNSLNRSPFFRSKRKDYLIAHGETPESADAIVHETETQESIRQEKRRERQRLWKKKNAFLTAHIFAGVQTVPPPTILDGETPEEQGRWFDGDSFAEILRRCEAHEIPVTGMMHDSSDGRTDREEISRRIDKPLELFHLWQSEGCNGKFTASFNVPDKLVQ
jgi:hypothetical protein